MLRSNLIFDLNLYYHKWGDRHDSFLGLAPNLNHL